MRYSLPKKQSADEIFQNIKTRLVYSQIKLAWYEKIHAFVKKHEGHAFNKHFHNKLVKEFAGEKISFRRGVVMWEIVIELPQFAGQEYYSKITFSLGYDSQQVSLALLEEYSGQKQDLMESYIRQLQEVTLDRIETLMTEREEILRRMNEYSSKVDDSVLWEMQLPAFVQY